MGLLFIIIGIIFVGYYFLSDSDKPVPVPAKPAFAVGGIAAIGLTVYLLYLIFYTSSSGGESLFFFILSAGSLYAGVKLFQLSANADSQHATNIADRTRAKVHEGEFETARYTLETARQTAEKDAALEDERRKTEAAALRNQRIELSVRNTLAETAEEQGLDVNSVIGINTQKYSTDIELENYAKTKAIDFQFRREEKFLEIQSEAELIRQQMDAADRVEHYDIIDNLEEKLKSLLKERRDIELNETDEWLKERNLARLDKRISQLEADIDGRQNRLLSSADRKETRRLT